MVGHARDASEPYGLTTRQVQILQLAADGLSAKQIARDLRISVRTVEGHFAAMRSRTGCVTVGSLTAWAVASGIVTVPLRSTTSHAGSGNSGNILVISGHTLTVPSRGRPRLMTAEKITEAGSLLDILPLTQIARQIGVSRGTLYAHMDAIRAARG